MINQDKYGHTYDDDYYKNFLQSKKRYDPYVVNKVDSYTRFDKYKDPDEFY